MALRLIRLVAPSGTGAFSAVNAAQKAAVHTSSVRRLQYGWLAYMLGERTTPRLTQSSKIISVEGNLASGKGVLAQKLADNLGMLYMPEADISYLDKIMKEKEPLPEIFNGMCNLEKFYRDPKAPDGNSYRLQLWLYIMRLLQYSDALEHLICTGQGVILERSPYSDMVFLDAMFKEGYIRKECVQHYNEVKGISICEFLPPHLIIYVDVPAEEVQQNLKQSSKPYHHDLPLTYLKSIEEAYKKSFLPEISKTSELLTYDATRSLDVERITEDIEFLKFNKGPWLDQDDISFHHLRMLVENKHRVVSLPNIPKFLPEITVGAHENDEANTAFRALPGKKYDIGYNEDIGDKNIWFK